MASTGYFHGDGYGAAEPYRQEAEHHAPRPRGATVATMANWLGALVSLALVVGMAIWAVQLTLRDVSGVPVIEALEGPMREPPADPGGTQAPHQGLAVNRIAEGAEAQPVPDRLVIAPPPVELRDVTLAAAVSELEPLEDAIDLEDVATSESLAFAGPEPRADEGAVTETAALIDRLLREAQSAAPEAFATPAAEAGLEPVPAVLEVDGTGQLAPIPVSVPGVARSLRPETRPGGLRMEQGVAAPEARADSALELAVADLADGTRLVQLGAFDTPEIARTEWTRLAERFPDYFADRPRVIEEASSGGQAFFRLRAAGFDDLAGARRFCAVLVAQGAACIPVTVR